MGLWISSVISMMLSNLLVRVAGLKTNEPIRIYDVEADAMTSMLSGLMGEAMLKVFAQLPISDFCS